MQSEVFYYNFTYSSAPVDCGPLPLTVPELGDIKLEFNVSDLSIASNTGEPCKHDKK